MSVRINELYAKQEIDGVEFSVGMWIKVIAGAFSGLEGYIKEIHIKDDGTAEFSCFLDYPCDVTRAIVEARFSNVAGRYIVLQELGIEDVLLNANEVYPADKAMTYSITGVGSLDLNELALKLRELGLKEFAYHESISIDAYLYSLPDVHIPQLAEKTGYWVRAWGNGGGDYSTECRLRETIDECSADVTARELARVMYNSIADDYKTAYQAVTLVCDAINETLEELKTGGELSEVC